jgi:hypothetical protein
MVKAIDDLDAGQELRHLVAKLPLEPKAQRRAVRHGKRGPVHLVGENRLRVERVNKIDALCESESRQQPKTRAIPSLPLSASGDVTKL